MSAPTLFDAPETQGRSRKSDPQTSVDAAKTVKVGSQRWLVMAALCSGDYFLQRGVTADDMEQRHPTIHRSTWSARLGQMKKAGLLEEAGTRLNSRGLWVLAYRLTDKGREALP